MPQLEFQLSVLVQSWGDDLLVVEALLFPETSCCDWQLDRVRKVLVARTRETIKRLEPEHLFRRRAAPGPQLASLEVDIPPLADDVCRKLPAQLKLHYVHWRHGDDAAIAYFPALEIEVLAENEARLTERLVPHVKAALARWKSSASLRDLVQLDRRRSLEVKPLKLLVKLPTLKERAKRDREASAAGKSVLKQAATDLVAEPTRPIYEREPEVARLAELLTGRMPRSVLLVGKSGVGKSALVNELARRRIEFALGSTPFWSTSGSRLIAGMSGFGMWQDRCEKLVREASKTKAIVHLDNFIELIEVGKGGGNTQGIAAVLRPAISRGSLLAVVECTPEQIAIVEREDPQLLEAFAQLEVAEPSETQNRSILARATQAQSKMLVSDEALATLDGLHRRFATYSASPGRPLRFLRNLLDDHASTGIVDAAEVTAAFSHETGLPHFMLDDAWPLDLAATRRWFTDRVIGQTEPVDLVVDLMATVKSGLARRGKPIASLLFIGPTGVGKTEMAKALAEFLYQDPGRMIRFDMSEYAHPLAVDRLVGGAYSSQGLLTQKVRDQPFMVVLLDEFEKADPLVFDMLLQVLGEGRLTDGAGRVADFTNSLIIMTSNLGAESFRRSLTGFAGSAAVETDSMRHFEREVKAFLRPEMFNRIDRIVPFAPLGREVIAQIARGEVNRIMRRDGFRTHETTLDIDEGAVQLLADLGYDARYGARPLKRTIERRLVAPLAERLSRALLNQALRFSVRADGGELQLDATTQRTTAEADQSLSRALAAVVDLRRKLQALERSGVVLRLRNEIDRLKQIERDRERRYKKRGRQVPFVFSREQAQLLEQEKLLHRVDSLVMEACELEDNATPRYHLGEVVDAESINVDRAAMQQQLHELLYELHQAQGGGRQTLTVAIYGESLEHVIILASAYQRVCLKYDRRVACYWLKRYRINLDLSAPEHAHRGDSGRAGVMPVMHLKNRIEREGEATQKVVDVYSPPADQFLEPPSDCIGVALQIVAARPAALLETESGKHEFLRGPNRSHTCVVETSEGILLKYDPAANVGRSGWAATARSRRIYDLAIQQCFDELLAKTLPLGGKLIDDAVELAVESHLEQRAWSLLD